MFTEAQVNPSQEISANTEIQKQSIVTIFEEYIVHEDKVFSDFPSI